jgi:alkanesulfonate monooxygenase SsuD/methylene tetrahydromethanopterin reductase-like flavin-dependent oxidoreductase (luciferase family)
VVAAEVAQFDNMARGRFLLGVGAGSLPSDFELLGTFDQVERGRRVIESVELMQRIWSETPPYDMQGATWRVKLERTVTPEIGFGALPSCFQKPHPPIFVPAVSAHSRTLQEAGRRGWWPISSALPLPDIVRTQWETFTEGCHAAGRVPDPAHWRVVRTVLVAPTDEQARARVHHADSAHRYFFGHLRTVFGQVGMLSILHSRPDMSDDQITVESLLDSRVIYGSPHSVLDRLVSFRDHVGPFGTMVVPAMDWSGPNRTWEQESMHLLANEVLPAWRQRLRAKAAE